MRGALRGASHGKYAAVSRPKLPVTKDILEGLVQQASAQRNEWIAGRDAALFVLSWSGMLRSAEAHNLDWADVVVAPEGIMLYIPFSKTDQVGEGAWVFLQDQEGPLGVVSLMRNIASAV